MTCTKKLNTYLANLAVWNVKLHNLHWNVTGHYFKPLHEMTESIYDEVFEAFDSVAEIMKMKGEMPLSTMSEYLAVSTIKEVPAEKVINGIPFFTRLWSETPKTQEELNQEAGTEAADYPMKVTSEALGMSTARDKISQAGAETTLDETTGNNYATWEADGVTYEIWLEDATSIEPKLQLMKENKLAGTAAWALGQESSDIWDLILKYVN